MSLGSIAAPDWCTGQSEGRYCLHEASFPVFVVESLLRCNFGKNQFSKLWIFFQAYNKSKHLSQQLKSDLTKMAYILVAFSELNGFSWQGCWLLSCSRSIIVNYANTNTNTHIITQRVIMPISFLKNGNKNNISMVNRQNIITTMGQGTFRMFLCISFQGRVAINKFLCIKNAGAQIAMDFS